MKPSSDPADDAVLLGALRAGDEPAFAALVREWHGPMIGVALGHVRGHALAEEVVQDTWLAVLRGLPAFRGQSSLRTWVFAILANRAKTSGIRERRSLPFSAVGAEQDPSPAERGAQAPSAEAAALRREALHELCAAIGALPPAQRTVITLREIEGRPSEDVAAALGVTRINERVLLHRARRGVRSALDAGAVALAA